MLLYICEKCGTWLDMKLVQGTINQWNGLVKFFNQPNFQVKEQPKPSCPQGHGLMRFVRPDDRLMLRPQERGAKQEKEPGKILTFRPKPGVEITLIPLRTDELKRLMEEGGLDGSA